MVIDSETWYIANIVGFHMAKYIVEQDIGVSNTHVKYNDLLRMLNKRW